MTSDLEKVLDDLSARLVEKEKKVEKHFETMEQNIIQKDLVRKKELLPKLRELMFNLRDIEEESIELETYRLITMIYFSIQNCKVIYLQFWGAKQIPLHKNGLNLIELY